MLYFKFYFIFLTWILNQTVLIFLNNIRKPDVRGGGGGLGNPNNHGQGEGVVWKSKILPDVLSR